jgi:hypothetical protein
LATATDATAATDVGRTDVTATNTVPDLTETGEWRFFDLVTVPTRPFQKKGYDCCDLAHMTTLYKSGPQLTKLAERMTPDNGSSERPIKRFTLHFFGQNRHLAPERSKPAWRAMEKLYKTELCEELEKEMYQGDGDKYYGAKQLIDNVMDHKHCYHIVLTGLKKRNPKRAATELSDLEPEAIAAVSFCSSLSRPDFIFLSLCVVSSGQFTKDYGGNKCDNLSWRRRGLMTLLLSTCAQVHRSLCQHRSAVSCLVSPTTASLPIFEHLGFTRTAYNFKKCYGSPYYEKHSNDIRIFLDKNRTAAHVPFVTEGHVFSRSCELLWN